MHSVSKPKTGPAELALLRSSGSEDFGPMGPPLDEIFGGVCVYCERTPLSRSPFGVGYEDTDLPNTRFFTCDHFRPRRLLCNSDPDVGGCCDTTPPHASDCPIYDWDNLVYACQSCADVKGGQWPAGQDATYVDPCVETGSGHGPNAVFTYEITMYEDGSVNEVESGRVKVHDEITGADRTNAKLTIADLALNDPRGPIESTHFRAGERKVSLAEMRGRWVRHLHGTFDGIGDDADQGLMRHIVREFADPSCRFSSISRQFIATSKYSVYL